MQMYIHVIIIQIIIFAIENIIWYRYSIYLNCAINVSIKYEGSTQTHFSRPKTL